MSPEFIKYDVLTSGKYSVNIQKHENTTYTNFVKYFQVIGLMHVLSAICWVEVKCLI